MSNSVIKKAVEPLRQSSIDRIENETREMLKDLREWMDSKDWNVPTSSTLGYHYSKLSFDEQIAIGIKYNNHQKLEPYRQYSCQVLTQETCCGCSTGSDSYQWSDEGAEKFIEKAKEDASIQYDKFIQKLENKIGDCESAKLEGDHIWDYSLLTIVKDGTDQVWSTRMILNISKNGKLFNQFPTRKIKTN